MSTVNFESMFRQSACLVLNQTRLINYEYDIQLVQELDCLLLGTPGYNR